jgi:hypothetical protein
MTATPPAGDGNRNHPNPARVYNCLLGGTDHTIAEQAVATRLMQAKPQLRDNVRANRRLLARMVRYLSARGVRQFLDIGTGLPTMDNTHEVAQRAHPDSRIVYVDNDPMVVAYARALMTSTPQGKLDYLNADLRWPGIILKRARDTLDFRQPLAILLLGILYMIPDTLDPYALVAQLTRALPRGGYLAISHPASDLHAAESAAGAEIYSAEMGIPQTNRTRAQVTRFFDGLDLIDPGVVPLNHWKPDDQEDPELSISSWAGLGTRR